MANIVKVRSDVPPPQKRPRASYPWESLAVGQSFEWKGPPRHSYKAAQRATLRLKPKRFRAAVGPDGITAVWRER